MRIILFFAVSVISISLFSQKGIIRGTVIEDATAETLVGASVYVAGTTTGTITDLDGNFTLQLTPGTHTIKVSFISYQDITIENVQVTSNEVVVIDHLRLKDADLMLNEIVVKAEAVRTNEIALMNIRKSADKMMDGISSAKMSLIGDATAVEAIKRVTGVTIEGGKYIYVRGLGDRYSKTMLNNVDIPGLDPDKNTLQMDIFPTNLISNITVSKTFTADLPADFTGGLVNIETLAFPERKKQEIAVGTSYNPSMHFNSDYISYDGGKLDFLGIDDGTRSLPAPARNENIPSPVHPNSNVNSFLKDFSQTMAVKEQTSLMNMSASLSMGNQIELDTGNTIRNRKLGYILSFSYKNEYNYLDDVFYGDYQKSMNNDVYDLIYADKKNGQVGQHSVLTGVLSGIALKSSISKYRLMVMHLQKGESTSSKLSKINNSEAVGQSGYRAVSDVLTYNQSSLSNLLLSGSHVLSENIWKLDWSVSPTYSYSADPDIRETPFSIDEQGRYAFNGGEGGMPSRTWRYLNELNIVSKIDIARKYSLREAQATIKFGASHVSKFRDYEILGYDIQFWGNQPDWNQPDPNLLLQDDNLYPNGSVYYMNGQGAINPNEYQSSNHTTAIYVSNELEVVKNMKAITGLRIENFSQRHTGRDPSYANGDPEGINLENEQVLASLDFFPSLSVIYTITENKNLRFAYSNTIARPSFKEVSYAQIIDPITDLVFNGGLYTYDNWDGNIKETRISNIDARYEIFMDQGQIISFSGFAKTFNKPIEIVRIPTQQTSIEVQPRNVGNGRLVGLEVEFVKSLGFISPLLDDFSLNGNFTYAYSEIDMSADEYQSRQSSARTGEQLNDKRPMAGQAPWVVNGGLAYSNRETGLDAGVFYNVKGPTLAIVGMGIFPDVYSVPFHNLGLSLNKKFGRDKKMAIGVKFSNVLNERNESVFHSYKASTAYHSIESEGRSFSISYSLKF